VTLTLKFGTSKYAGVQVHMPTSIYRKFMVLAIIAKMVGANFVEDHLYIK